MFYSKFGENFGPAALLGLGILVLICTDSIFAYQNLHETYISGGLLDTGWILSFILVGLAAFLQVSQEKLVFDKFSRVRLWFQNMINMN